MSVRKKKKISKKNKVFVFSCLILLFLFLILLIILSIFKFFGQDVYLIEERTDNIINEKKKDTDNIKTVGWIRVQGTNIDYPIIYAPDYDFSYKVDDFTWTEADFSKLNNAIFVSGHNILNQSANPEIGSKNHTRFEQLMSFTYYDFVKENQYIQYTFGGKDYIYKIYAVYYDDDSELDLYTKKFYSREEMRSFIDDALKKNIYDFDVDVREDDYMISLVTCTKMFGYEKNSFVVVGRLLRDGEEVILSKVSKSSQYKNVEKQMKGGEVYEDV